MRPAILAVLASLAAAPALAQERVAVRTADHPGLGRMVFDWSTPPAYQVEQDGERIRLRFPRAAALELPGPRRLPRNVLSIERQDDAIVLRVSPGARFRHFRNGAKVALDILDAVPASTSRREAAPPQEEAPAAISSRRAARAGTRAAASLAAAPAAPPEPVLDAVAPPPPEPAAPPAAAPPAKRSRRCFPKRSTRRFRSSFAPRPSLRPRRARTRTRSASSRRTATPSGRNSAWCGPARPAWRCFAAAPISSRCWMRSAPWTSRASPTTRPGRGPSFAACRAAPF
jgi:hypothetical protein